MLKFKSSSTKYEGVKMKISKLFPFIFLCSICFAMPNENTTGNNIASGKNTTNDNISSIKVKDMNGKMIPLSSYKGKVLLIVNVASKCGFTPQYKGLEELYNRYKDKGFEILGFPCNDFGQQEPGTNAEIKRFCTEKYNVTFKLFDKIKVQGDEKTPLYAKLTNNDVTGKSDIGWNFEKFLIDKNGNIVARFRSKITPLSKEITSAIEKELDTK
jgi:glutathione peroxidase